MQTKLFQQEPLQPLNEAISELIGKTSYLKQAPLEQAPQFTDCVTSLYYIFKKAFGVDICPTFIGDLPRQLCASSEWRVVKIDSKDVCSGDILFVKHKGHKRLISHMALFLGIDKVFHCSLQSKTAVIQAEDAFFSVYEQELNFTQMLRYIDVRNKKREIYGGGGFIPI